MDNKTCSFFFGGDQIVTIQTNFLLKQNQRERFGHFGRIINETGSENETWRPKNFNELHRIFEQFNKK